MNVRRGHGQGDRINVTVYARIDIVDIGPVPTENGCIKAHVGYVLYSDLLVPSHDGYAALDLRNACIIKHLRYPVLLDIRKHYSRSLLSVPESGVANDNLAVQFLQYSVLAHYCPSIG